MEPWPVLDKRQFMKRLGKRKNDVYAPFCTTQVARVFCGHIRVGMFPPQFLDM